ncbi:MAG: hypothetical protein EA350_06400 [Gemmatimonadales bacterium]|nr:MAG: hypothetical protein EA350_06400 [Gemmatimonadales bacterium]
MDLRLLDDVPFPSRHLQARVRIHPLTQPAERFPEPFEDRVPAGSGPGSPRQYPGPGCQTGPPASSGNEKVEPGLPFGKRAEEIFRPGRDVRPLEPHQFVQAVRRKCCPRVALDHGQNVPCKSSGRGRRVGWVGGRHRWLRLG